MAVEGSSTFVRFGWVRIVCVLLLMVTMVTPDVFATGETSPEISGEVIVDEGIEEDVDDTAGDEISQPNEGEQEIPEEITHDESVQETDDEIVVHNASQLALYAREGLILPNFNEMGEPISAEFEHAFVFVGENGVEATLPKGLTVSTADGGSFNLVALDMHDIAADELEAEGFDINTVEGSTKFGIPGQGLHFSTPVKLQIPAPNVADGEVVFVQVKHGDSDEYTFEGLTNNPDATCENGISSDESNGALVENGMATIYTCGASTFVLLTGIGAGDALLGTDLVEIGINQNGVFGADVTSVPEGFHASREPTFFGFIANPLDNNRAEYDGDFFTPGSEEEGFCMEINGTNYCNNKMSNLTQIPGGIASVATGTFQGRQGVQLVWTGTAGGMSVVRTYIIHEDQIYILMRTTLTNTTAGTLSGVYWMHNVDPDNNQTINGSYTTRNTIISQPGTSGLNYAQVEAYQATGGGIDTDGSVVSFFADDARSKVSHGGFSNRDASDIYTGAGAGGPYYQTVGTQRTEDKAISLAFSLGDMAAGESITINYAYNLAQEVDDIVEVIESINTSVCGDGTMALSESCDDGDTDNGDGCSSICEIETDYECTGEPSVCVNTAAVCGNELIETGEVCDDGNTDNGDGCSSSCEVEEGFTCDEASPSVCTGICGDGLILGAEECDDENTTNGDGCSSTCEIELRHACTGEPSVCVSTAGGRTSSNTSKVSSSKTTKKSSGDAENSSVDNDEDASEKEKTEKMYDEDRKEKKPETKKEKAEDQYAAEVINDDPLAPAFVPRNFIADDLMGCNEDEYIAKRREKLSQQPENQVYTIPQEYQEAVDEHKRTYLDKLIAFIGRLSSEAMRQRVIEEVVCKIESKKAKENKKHEHTGYGSTTNVYEYLLQYTQDVVILERK